ncbi:MAG: tetratricopeptide repeat protein [Pseudomonadota bacterium]|nr:tetratricopeptide repeat protein [Pseudomonadota bacterium]
MHAYSEADLKRLFHLSASLVRSLTRAGHIHPLVDEGKTSYSFQDLLVLRTAGALRAAKIPAAKITVALGKIRAALPSGSALSALSLRPAGRDIAVREGTRLWESHTGQYALPLAGEPEPSNISILKPRGHSPAAVDEAQGHFDRAFALEESDVAAARAAYLDCLSAHKDHVEARINLGRLLHLEGDLGAAEKVYRQVKTASATLSFNLAILLEDLNREEEAVGAYREALALDPNLHDAHFNLARLHERAKRPRDALRHLLAYKRSAARSGGA